MDKKITHEELNQKVESLEKESIYRKRAEKALREREKMGLKNKKINLRTHLLSFS